MHILLIGPPGSGKSELIQKITDILGMPVYGYETVKEDHLAVEGKGSPIYIYEIGKPHERTVENLAGWCLDHHATTYPEAFTRFAPKLRRNIPKDCLIVLDEIGSMESRSPAFCDAILARLDGDIPVVAAVRDKDTAFLHSVRSHPKCRCFRLPEEASDSILSQIIQEVAP